jgi:hypothetical protein
MTPEEAKKIVDAHASQLSEHFEAVQILCSYPLECGTQPSFSGRGNWFARQGMAHDFISSENAEQIAMKLTAHQDD